MMRTLVIGDIHGAHKALLQCLERSNYDISEDRLIHLGDVVDGFPEVYECVETLLSLGNLISIKGNHDEWFLEFIKTAYHPCGWAKGGQNTIQSYGKRLDPPVRIIFGSEGNCKTSLNPEDIPLRHQIFFHNQQLFFIDESSRCFVHGGFDRLLPFYDQRPQNYYWNRTLWTEALDYHTMNNREKQYDPFYMVSQFHEVFIGHTHTTNWGTDKPLRAVNVLNLDNGAGRDGKLTIMDIDTKEYWQSDLVQELYA